MFADGNGGFARMIVKTLLPDAVAGPETLEGVTRGAVKFDALDRGGSASRIRLTSTVVWVRHDGSAEKSDTLTIAYTRGGSVYRVKARSAILAGGSWTSKHSARRTRSSIDHPR
jgi:spermidine dehydrogenase